MRAYGAGLARLAYIAIASKRPAGWYRSSIKSMTGNVTVGGAVQPSVFHTKRGKAHPNGVPDRKGGGIELITNLTLLSRNWSRSRRRCASDGRKLTNIVL